METMKSTGEEVNSTAGVHDSSDVVIQAVMCIGCKGPITDSQVMKVNGSFWHQTCLRCCICSVQLLESCFFDKHHRLYCKTDYMRALETAKCCFCTSSISANDLVYRVFGRIYHIRCFICYRCNIPLRKGDQYILHGNGDLVCKVCTDESGLHIGPDMGCRRDKREVKRPRTVLSSVQRRGFKEAFDKTPRPCRKEREKLSSQTGLSVRVVQVWFQNQRAKVKKLARRKANKEKNTSHHTSDSDMEEKNYYEEGEAKVTSSIEGYPEITSPSSCDISNMGTDQNYTTLIPTVGVAKKRYGNFHTNYTDQQVCQQLNQHRMLSDSSKTYQVTPSMSPVSHPHMFYEGAVNYGEELKSNGFTIALQTTRNFRSNNKG